MILDRSLSTRFRQMSLGDLVVDGPTNGYSGPTGPDAKGSPTLRLSATTSGTCVLDETTTKRLYETIPPDSDLWLEPGDLLVQRSNTIDLVGTAAIFDGPRRSYVYPDLMMRLRLREAMTARFVWRYINSRAGRTFFSRMAAGSSGSMPKISGAKLRTMQIPLPPLAVQRRIAEVLDRAEALRAKRRAAHAQLDTLTRVLFLDLFGNPATNPKGWAKSVLGDVATFVGGGTPSRACPEYFTGTICWATSKDIKSEFLNDTEEHITEEAIGRSATKLVPAETILVVVKSKILAHHLPVAVARVSTCFGQDLKGIRLSNRCEVSFVATALRLGKRWLLERARGINTEGLTLDHLRAFPLMMPPLRLQSEFARRVTVVERLKATHRASLAEMDALFASLQHRAFRGEL
jgi:type I restriction enzyme, S subunit